MTPQHLADESATTDYTHVRNTLEFITDNWREQPSLEVIAGEAGLSPGHLQRVFKRWAGISPKERRGVMDLFRANLNGYTYFES